MKVNKSRSGFRPISLDITFESEEELSQFFAIFNHGRITSTMCAIDADRIREVIKDTNNGDLPDYQPHHDRLSKEFR